MNHDDAIKSMAAEGYILGELEPSERDAFEEHFFECTICADDVRDSAKFAAGVRTSDARFRDTGRFSRWAAAAAVAASMGLGYHYVPQIARWNHDPVPAPVQLAAAEQPVELEATRSVGKRVHVRPDQPVALYFIIPPPEHVPSFYTCDLLDSTGRKIATRSVSRAQAQDTVALHLKAQTLRAGQYEVVIRGGDREIASYPFTVEVP